MSAGSVISNQILPSNKLLGNCPPWVNAKSILLPIVFILIGFSWDLISVEMKIDFFFLVCVFTETIIGEFSSKSRRCLQHSGDAEEHNFLKSMTLLISYESLSYGSAFINLIFLRKKIELGS